MGTFLMLIWSDPDPTFYFDANTDAGPGPGLGPGPTLKLDQVNNLSVLSLHYRTTGGIFKLF
jgi:hypothetical protein